MPRVPTHDEAARAVKAGSASSLDHFVYEFEPAHPDITAEWRGLLQAVIDRIHTAPREAPVYFCPHGVNLLIQCRKCGRYRRPRSYSLRYKP